MRVAVLNGVNLDVLHRRDPELYGGLSLNQLERLIYDWAVGAVVNPGAWSHYSYAIRDALELLEVPVVEVHLSNIEQREEWRRHSVIADIAAERILGKGPDGYREALAFLAEKRA